MPPRIFLIEDAPPLREVVVLMLDLMEELELAGSAGSGEEALEKIGALEPDVILVDGSLPGISGVEFIRKAKGPTTTTKFIFFSGRDEPEIVREALDAGACGYLVKGGEPNEMLKAVRACLDGECYISPTVCGWQQLTAGQAF